MTSTLGPLFPGLSNQPISRQLPQPPRPVPVVDLDVLQNASRVLQDQFVKDSQIIPDLGDTLNICTIIIACAFKSYLADQHLLAGGSSSCSYTGLPDDFRVPFQKRRLVGIPESLFQYYNSELISYTPVIFKS